jgi:ubiquinol-cytochrome c reductase cytochrome c subunit
MKRYGLALLVLPAALWAQQPGNAENGRKLFVKNGCYQCHGYEGQGGGAGARLVSKSLSTAGFIAYVRKPPAGGMPVYSPKIMSDAELTDVWTFLKTQPDPPPVASIPLLSDK